MKPMLATRYYPSQTKFPCFVQPKYDGCVRGDTRIYTDAGILYIKDIVENQMKVKALSEKDGSLVYRDIVAWANNGSEKSVWYEVSVDGHLLRCTDNHNLLTQRGYIRADELKDTDHVACRALSDYGIEILNGMLFGDSCLIKDYGKDCWRTHICSNVKEFAAFKADLLGLEHSEPYPYTSGYGRDCYRINIEAVTTFIDPLKYMEYRSHKFRRRKCIRVKELMEMLSDNSLSIWYADDGTISFNNGNKKTPRIFLSTHRYSVEQVREFIKFFVIKYDCCPTMVKDKRVGEKGDGAGYYLTFTTEDSFKLLDVLRFRAVKGLEYKYYYSDLEYLKPAMLKTAFKPISYIHKKTTVETKYDIEVFETHNYVANGLVIHNCRCILHEGEDGKVHLTSRGGKEYDVPQIKAWGEKHRGMLPLDGEIYNHQELTFQQICSAVKCRSAMTDKLRMVIYDAQIPGSFSARWKVLQEEFASIDQNGPVYLTQTFVAHSEKDIKRWHKIFVSTGYEGAIIRNADGIYTEGRSNDLMKLKSFDTTEFKVVDVLEAEGNDAGTAIFKLKCGEYEFCARPVGSRSLRAQYLADKEELIGMAATVQHQGYSDAGVPRFPVLLNIRDYE